MELAAPNLILGNVIVLKHASQCPESAAAIEAIYRDAGLPEGAYVNVYVSAEQFNTVTSMDKAAWLKELELHTELFKQLEHHLPKELGETKAAIEKRLAA